MGSGLRNFPQFVQIQLVEDELLALMWEAVPSCRPLVEALDVYWTLQLVKFLR